MSGGVAFLTLFFGLTAGPQRVAVAVAGPAAAVELRLDGREVARLVAPRWEARVDFGEELAPRRLEAVAFDAAGAELGRATQRVNVPRSLADVELLVERAADGRPAAVRVSAQNVTGGPPLALSVTLDGKPLQLRGGRAELPPLDLEAAHVVSAEAQFAPLLVAHRDLVFGGRYGYEAAAELTAVPVRWPPGEPLPAAPGWQGWLEVGGGAAVVAAVESGPAEALVVRDVSTAEARRQLGTTARRILSPGAGTTVDPNYLRFELRLGKADTARLVFPRVRTITTTPVPTHLFDGSQAFGWRDGGLLWILTQISGRPGEGPPRYADAVAVAGLQAAAGNRRRAVVYAVGAGADASLYEPAVVRRYLDTMRVPLHVWSLVGADHAAVTPWQDAVEVSDLSGLRRAVAALRRDLDTQKIVWIEGSWTPAEVRLTAAAPPGLTLVGAAAAPPAPAAPPSR